MSGQVSGSTPPAPPEDHVPSFEDLGLHPDLLRAVRAMGFERPTPIQVRAIPPILAGRDVVGCAQTGTGKTAAFILPILHRLLGEGPGRGNVRALVVAPTRELALQSAEHLKALSRYVPVRGAAIFGGVPMDYQIRALAQGVEIVSATPGRLLDHIYSGRVDFVDIEVFVLDEVDRMLDMGFLPDMQRIISFLPPQRQRLAFSATLPEEILALVRQLLRDPVVVQVGQRTTPVEQVQQTVYLAPRHRKLELLVELIRRQRMTSVLVFTRTKVFASRLAQHLERQGLRVSLLHGDRTQGQRLRALELFRRGRNQVMVATEIAARGLDIEGVSHVVNYDVPETPEAYIHRIGRTARAGATGDALTLMAPEEEPLVQAIEQAIHHQLTRQQLPGMPDRPEKPQRRSHHLRHRR